MIKLTELNHAYVYINTCHIAKLARINTSHTEVYLQGEKHATVVQESPDEIMRLIKEQDQH